MILRVTYKPCLFSLALLPFFISVPSDIFLFPTRFAIGKEAYWKFNIRLRSMSFGLICVYISLHCALDASNTGWAGFRQYLQTLPLNRHVCQPLNALQILVEADWLISLPLQSASGLVSGSSPSCAISRSFDWRLVSGWCRTGRSSISQKGCCAGNRPEMFVPPAVFEQTRWPRPGAGWWRL